MCIDDPETEALLILTEGECDELRAQKGELVRALGETLRLLDLRCSHCGGAGPAPMTLARRNAWALYEAMR